MKKTIKLTETDLMKIINRVINEESKPQDTIVSHTIKVNCNKRIILSSDIPKSTDSSKQEGREKQIINLFCGPGPTTHGGDIPKNQILDKDIY